MAKHPSWTQRFLSEADFEAITRAIKAAESKTSAEIRVHLERRVPRRLLLGRRPDVVTRAHHVFRRLGMHRTAERHGVLVYLAVEDRRLAVVGDEGIHGRVGDPHWHRVRDVMVERLKSNAPREAIERAVEELGRALAEHYPRRPDDVNELSDEVTVS
jgi:uncharacterized membrane protein